MAKIANIIRDASELAKMGVSLAKNIAEQDEQIALYLLSEVMHIEEHRNPTRLNQFFSMVKGSGARVNAMHAFVQFFGNVDFNQEANSAIRVTDGVAKIAEIKGTPSKFARKGEDGSIWAVWYSMKKGGARKTVTVKIKENNETVVKKLTLEEHFARAENLPWFKFQPERPPVVFNADEKLKGVLKSIWSNLLGDDPVIMNQAFVNDLTELAFKHGVITTAADIIPDAKAAKVPAKYKPTLHLATVDGKHVEATKEQEDAAKNATETPVNVRKRTAAKSEVGTVEKSA